MNAAGLAAIAQNWSYHCSLVGIYEGVGVFQIENKLYSLECSSVQAIQGA